MDPVSWLPVFSYLRILIVNSLILFMVADYHTTYVLGFDHAGIRSQEETVEVYTSGTDVHTYSYRLYNIKDEKRVAVLLSVWVTKHMWYVASIGWS